MSLFPPYSGDDPGPECPKCGGRGAMTTYHNQGYRFIAGGPQICTETSGRFGEHLDRECRTCGYFWPEACADDPGHAETVTHFFNPKEWER